MEQESKESPASRFERLRMAMRPWAHTAVVPTVSVLVAVLVIGWFVPTPQANGTPEGPVLSFFRGLRENLPLTLPILSACLSIMLNVREILRQPHGWLRLPLPLSLGLVSFSIWYVVAAQSTTEQFIRIGSQKVLDREYAVLLLVIAFIWAGFAALGRVLGEIHPEEERGWRWYGAQALLLVVSLVGLSVPFFLFESKTAVEARLSRSLDEAYFSVSIPFRDASLNQHLGRAADPITQCEVFLQVSARTATDAIGLARKRFLASSRSTQQYAKSREGEVARQVEILESWIVAERQAALLP